MGLKETISRKIFINLMEKVVDAYHGSPHKFDKFNTDRIGTGEGVQAFGWGLYFTDLESIAQDYARKLSRVNTIDEVFDKLNLNQDTKTFRVRQVLYDFIPNTSKGEWLLKDIENGLYNSFREDEIETLRKFAEYKIKNLYKVSLHKGKTPDQYIWLEWDKPLNNFIINKIEKQFKLENYKGRVLIKNNKVFYIIGDLTEEIVKGKDLYYALAGDWGQTNKIEKFNAKETSLFLLRAGIDGIKYPAESIARGATSDNARGFNYVVFDENAVTIDYVKEF